VDVVALSGVCGSEHDVLAAGVQGMRHRGLLESESRPTLSVVADIEDHVGVGARRERVPMHAYTLPGS
jgi:hypothetical protein